MNLDVNLFVRCLIAGFILSSLFSCAEPGALDRTRLDNSILNGRDVQALDPVANSTVMIAKSMSFQKEVPQFFGICTGVIIKENFVLTAAHCVNSDTHQMRVIYARDARKAIDKEIFKVKNITLHPSFEFNLKYKTNSGFYKVLSLDDVIHYYDIALIELERPIKTISTQFLKANDEISQEMVFKATIAGFGRSVKEGADQNFSQINGILRKAEVDIVSNTASRSHFILRQFESDPAACVGDSGGPLYERFPDGQIKLRGIAVAVFDSRAERQFLNSFAGYNEPTGRCEGFGLYVNIAEISPWIFQTMRLSEDILLKGPQNSF